MASLAVVLDGIAMASKSSRRRRRVDVCNGLGKMEGL